MNFTVWSDGRFEFSGRVVRCALGPAGVVEAQAKREGDGATPLGVWPMLRVVYRPDRGEAGELPEPLRPFDAQPRGTGARL